MKTAKTVLSFAGILVFTALGYPTTLTATTIQVSAAATGSFGSPNDGATLLTPGFTFSGPGSIDITASGIIYDWVDQDGYEAIGANGTDFTSIYNDLLPLQEAQGIPADTSTKVLDCLMGTFVPQSIAGLPNFVPEDAAKVGPGKIGINASTLFFVGTGPLRFNAPGPGTLYLGINDSMALDNSGSFTVTSSAATPEPSNAILLLVGVTTVLGVWAWRRKVAHKAPPNMPTGYD